MITLVLGANGSGKSAYAEKLAARLSQPQAMYYIATMIPYGEEGRERVERHRVNRRGAGFITVEQAFNVSAIEIEPEATVLLEDVSNLLSNAVFGENKNESADSVYEDIKRLCEKSRDAVLVSISGLHIQPIYNEETRCYVTGLNELNERLTGLADAVIVMRDGAPVCVKGDAYALD